MKILLIDDDEMMRIFFRDIFWIHGHSGEYEITAVESVQKSEDLINNKETRPDIIFLDLLMPTAPGSGYSSMKPDLSINLLKKIKSDEELKKIKVVIFSSFREKEMKEKLIGYGADDYLYKGDFMPKEILEFVKKLK